MNGHLLRRGLLTSIATALLLGACGPSEPSTDDGGTSQGSGGAGGASTGNAGSTGNAPGGSSPGGSSPGGSGAGASGAGGAGGAGGVGPNSCNGSANTNGSVGSTTPMATIGQTQLSDAAALQLVLLPNQPLIQGDVGVELSFYPVDGQLNYPPLAQNQPCRLFQVAADASWQTLNVTDGCTISLTQLNFASAANLCDGAISGGFAAQFASGDIVTGSFSLALDISANQITPPICQPSNGPCDQNADCCSHVCADIFHLCW